MKHLFILAAFVVTLGVCSCKKQETCATYTKATKSAKADRENI